MHWLVVIIAIVFSTCLYAQDDAIARQYFDEGEFEKAVTYYKTLVAQNPRRHDYAYYLIESYQP